MKNLFSISLLFFLLSCATSKNTVADTPQTQNDNYPVYKVNATLDQKQEINTMLHIFRVEIKDNRLLIAANYTGSCEAIVFKAIGLELSPMEIQPVRQIQIYQPNIIDRCEKERPITLDIDVSAILVNKEKGSVNYFLLDGWPNRIEYIVP